MTESTTWNAAIDYVRSAAGRLRAAEHSASEQLLLGPGDAAANQSAALRRLVEGSRTASSDLTYALERLAELAPSTRPLEAVLADIEAEGHFDMDLGRYSGGGWYLRSHTATQATPNAAPGTDAWRTWRSAVEYGDAHAKTPAGAAEARLAQIQEMHAEKLAKDGITADVPPQVIHRTMDELAAKERPYHPIRGSRERDRLAAEVEAAELEAEERQREAGASEGGS